METHRVKEAEQKGMGGWIQADSMASCSPRKILWSLWMPEVLGRGWLQFLCTSLWATQWSGEEEAPGQGSPLHTSEFRRLLASSIPPLPLRAAGLDLAAFTAAAVPTSWNQPSWPCSSSKAITFLQVDIATSCPKQSCTVPLHF